MISITVICTGNAVRSVIAGALLSSSELGSSLNITTAGTLAVDGRPISLPTRHALDAVEIGPLHHLSHQLVEADLVDADLVIAMAGEHVRYVRRRHVAAASRTATLQRLCRDLGGRDAPLSTRVAELELAEVEIEAWEDVVDPAGGDEATYIRCAFELQSLISELLPRLVP